MSGTSFTIDWPTTHSEWGRSAPTIGGVKVKVKKKSPKKSTKILKRLLESKI